jgi:hypothetical protein
MKYDDNGIDWHEEYLYAVEKIKKLQDQLDDAENEILELNAALGSINE